jgi:hypothetical protein
MHLYLAGGETPSHLKTLKEERVPRIAVNIGTLYKRGTSLVDWVSDDKLHNVDWLLYADNNFTDWEPVRTLLQACVDCPPDAIIGPLAWVEQAPILLESDFAYFPVWDGTDNAHLRHLVETYGGLFIPDMVVGNEDSLRSAQAATSGPTNLLGAITGRSRGLEKFDAVISSAWWSVQKHGETQVWDGRFHRYSATDKLRKRVQHKDAIEALGINMDLVLADDPTELTRLAIRSWINLEHSTQVAPKNRAEETTSPESDIDLSGTPSIRIDINPRQGGHQTLPVIGMETVSVTHTDLNGEETIKETDVLSVNTTVMRQCNNCSLSLQCPGFQQNAACTYHIPVVIRSKDQLQAVMRALVEIQTQRILFGRFSEEVTGAPDPEVGREMDRLFKMVEKWKTLEDNRSTLDISIKANGDVQAQSGMLSRLFGSKVGSNASALEHPILTADIVD